MRETILASNLIRKLNFMRSATLAICLGLLPSQVFATTQTCETYPDCATMGYTQTSCNEYSISLRCPFDDSKLFCAGCDRNSIKDPNNNVCVDGKTYCANLGQPFDTAAGECGSCDNTKLFDKNQMKCVNNVNLSYNIVNPKPDKLDVAHRILRILVKENGKSVELADIWTEIEIPNNASGVLTVGIPVEKETEYKIFFNVVYKDSTGKLLFGYENGEYGQHDISTYIKVYGEYCSGNNYSQSCIETLKPHEFIDIEFREREAYY